MSTGEEFFDGIKVGDEMSPLAKNITRRQLFMYSAATWDFHPGHYDQAFAQSQGFKDVYLDGPMDAAFMVQLVTDWADLNGSLNKMSVTYKSMTFPDDTLTCTGKVVDKYVSNGAKLVDCEVLLKDQNSNTVATGKATITF